MGIGITVQSMVRGLGIRGSFSAVLEQLTQTGFQEAEGFAAMAVLFFLSQGHLGEGAARSCDFKDRVVAKALIPPGCGRDQAITTAFHLQQDRAVWSGDTERRAEIGLALV